MARTLSNACCCLALLSATAAGTACTDNITSPGADAPPADPGTPGGAGSAGVGVAATPERTTPDGIGWVTRFPKLSNEQWERAQ